MSSCDGVLTSATSSMSCPDAIRDTVGHYDNAAVSQSGDEDCIASCTDVSKIPQSTGKYDDLVPMAGREAKHRRRVFDEIMSNHFGSQRVDPTAKIKSSLAPPSSEEMFFGDLDFDADAAAFYFEEYDPTLNKQPATLPEMDIASSIDHKAQTI